MRLDRNVEGGHGNKYGLIKNRRLEELRLPDGTLPNPIANALLLLVNHGVLDWGCSPETEFFAIRLKDTFAGAALQAYAEAALRVDADYARDVFEMAMRSAAHPNRKTPD